VAAQPKPNIVIIWGDDIGQSNISAYWHGLMGQAGSGRARGQRARRLGGTAGPQEREDQQAPAARRGVKAKGGGR
jgi:arylsulfatase A-like enzyme